MRLRRLRARPGRHGHDHRRAERDDRHRQRPVRLLLERAGRRPGLPAHRPGPARRLRHLLQVQRRSRTPDSRTARTRSRCAMARSRVRHRRRARFTVDRAGHDDHQRADRADQRHHADLHLHRVRRRGATFQCRVDGGQFATCTSPFTTAALAQGAHTFEVRALDAAGNADPTPASRAFTIDTAAPDTTIAAARPGRSPRPRHVHLHRPPRPARRSSARSTAPPSAPAPRATPGSRRAAHLRGARDRHRRQHRRHARDASLDGRHRRAGHDAHADRQRRPTTPRRRSRSRSEAGATFQCRVDGGAYAACTSPLTTAALRDGGHTVRRPRRSTPRATSTRRRRRRTS